MTLQQAIDRIGQSRKGPTGPRPIPTTLAAALDLLSIGPACGATRDYREAARMVAAECARLQAENERLWKMLEQLIQSPTPDTDTRMDPTP